jgi:hypothetical protein
MLSHNLLLTGDDGYNLTKSLRFRSSASAYLNRTPASAGNRKTWTWSAWVKRGSQTEQMLFGCGVSGSDDSTYTYISFGGTNYDKIYVNGYTQTWRQTTQVFRDFSAWYHIIVAVDTTQATANNRIRLYVNGVEATSFTTLNNPSQNTDLSVNRNASHTISSRVGYGSDSYFDGYMSEVNFIDGQALTPSSFGSTNSLTGVWQPAKYTGTYGTNGFYLPFTNTTSTTTLGYDFSGNSNNWTTNNLSLTAGTTYDSMTDVPTLTSATTANYCTMNPLFAPIGGANFQALSNANLTISGTSGSNSGGSIGTMSSTTSKFYYEFTMTSISSGYCCVGSSDVDQLAGLTPFNYLGYGSKSYGYFSSGSKTNNNGTSAYGATYTTGDIISVAVDCTNGAIYFAKNGTWQASGDPTSGASKTGAAYTWTGASQNMIPQMDVYTTGAVMGFNCGQRAFSYTPPTGFVALNTFNLPTSTIVKGNTVMDATTYAGTSATQSVTNTAGFKPDFIWIKNRTGANDNILFDSNRGSNGSYYYELISNGTPQENYYTAGNYGMVSAINSNGFTLASSNSNWNLSNATGNNYVGWQWQAGQGSSSSNTSGSITSTVSVNASAGFSVVTYTGNGSTGATVGHSLGVAPAMIIVKKRSSTGNWITYHTSTGINQYLYLNSTSASATATPTWGVSSTTFTLQQSFSDYNDNGVTYVAYCWSEIAGFSKFGSYTGNGSTDGPFVYTGFRPKYVMIKITTTAGYYWMIKDSVRDPYNTTFHELYANVSDAEYTASSYQLDLLSNGFKIKNNGQAYNGSGDTYIYMAFAENPFKNALAR